MAAAPLPRILAVPGECQTLVRPGRQGEATSLSADSSVPQQPVVAWVWTECGLISLTDIPMVESLGTRRRMPLQVKKLEAHWLVR